MKFKFLCALLMTIIVGVSSCEKDDSKNPWFEADVITTGDATNVKFVSATLAGQINGFSVSEVKSAVNCYGFFYGTYEDSELDVIKNNIVANNATSNDVYGYLGSDVQVAKANSTGTITISIEGLKENTQYFYVAFAKLESGGEYVFGEVKTFKTEYWDKSVTLKNVTYIDEFHIRIEAERATPSIDDSNAKMQYVVSYSYNENGEKSFRNKNLTFDPSSTILVDTVFVDSYDNDVLYVKYEAQRTDYKDEIRETSCTVNIEKFDPEIKDYSHTILNNSVTLRMPIKRINALHTYFFQVYCDEEWGLVEAKLDSVDGVPTGYAHVVINLPCNTKVSYRPYLVIRENETKKAELPYEEGYANNGYIFIYDKEFNTFLTETESRIPSTDEAVDLGFSFKVAPFCIGQSSSTGSFATFQWKENVDVAKEQWGNGWRMMEGGEMWALFRCEITEEKCKDDVYYYIKDYGYKSPGIFLHYDFYRVTSKTNGNSVVLPESFWTSHSYSEGPGSRWEGTAVVAHLSRNYYGNAPQSWHYPVVPVTTK